MDLKPSEKTTEAEMIVANHVFLLDDSIAFVYITPPPPLLLLVIDKLHIDI